MSSSITLEKSKNLSIALAGNPNCGKTTLFNEITGSKQHVGNWPGVTVEKKEGKYKKDKAMTIVDLPGIYSLSPYSAEEIVARNYIVEEKPDVLINIIDGTNIERNMYLTLQILETGIPTVVALNMMDEVESSGTKIDIDKISKALGVKVVPIVARNGKNIDILMDEVKKVSKEKNKELNQEIKKIKDRNINLNKFAILEEQLKMREYIKEKNLFNGFDEENLMIVLEKCGFKPNKIDEEEVFETIANTNITNEEDKQNSEQKEIDEVMREIEDLI